MLNQLPSRTIALQYRTEHSIKKLEDCSCVAEEVAAGFIADAYSENCAQLLLFPIDVDSFTQNCELRS